jgi:outer membrane biogenesis lipoprotein LolB
MKRNQGTMKMMKTGFILLLGSLLLLAGCMEDSSYPEQPQPTTSPSWSGTNRQIIQLGSYGDTVAFACFGPNGIYKSSNQTVVIVDDKNCTEAR